MKFEIDQEAADRITVLNLKDYRKYLKKEFAEWKRNPQTDTNPDGKWLHPDDASNSIHAIDALNLIIKHYGEE